MYGTISRNYRRRRPRITAQKKVESPYGKLTGCSGGLNLNPASIGLAESTVWFDRIQYFSRSRGLSTGSVVYSVSTGTSTAVQLYSRTKFSKSSA